MPLTFKIRILRKTKFNRKNRLMCLKNSYSTKCKDLYSRKELYNVHKTKEAMGYGRTCFCSSSNACPTAPIFISKAHLQYLHQDQ